MSAGISLSALAAQSAPVAEILIHVGRPGMSISPTLYGAFFEDINRAGGRGL
jgi:hypothetical protein